MCARMTECTRTVRSPTYEADVVNITKKGISKVTVQVTLNYPWSGKMGRSADVIEVGVLAR